MKAGMRIAEPTHAYRERQSGSEGGHFNVNHPSPNVDEKTFSLFQPDILIQSQYFQHMRRKNPLGPEKRLMLAILEDAVTCFQKQLRTKSTKGKTLFRDAEAWILEEDGSWLFSFANICEMLGLNADYVRRGLIQWKQTSLVGGSRAQVYRLGSRSKERKHSEQESDGGGEKLLKVGSY